MDDTGRTAGSRAEREDAEQYRVTVAHTADLVRKLIALADRYDAEVPQEAGRAAVRHECAVLMRAAAEAGRQLIRSKAPPVSAGGERAGAAPVERSETAAPPAPGREDQARSYALTKRLEDRATLRRAQGVLMQRSGLTAGEAFEAMLQAATGGVTLQAVAEHVLRTAELPARHHMS